MLIAGTNLQALIDATSTTLDADISFVLSSRSNAYGLTRAKNHHIPTAVCALKTYLNRHPGATREDYDAEVARIVLDSAPDLVVLAGWMHILSDSFLDILNGATEAAKASTTSKRVPNFPIPIINLHPALPGAFDGAQAIERAYAAFQEGKIEKTGVMVHRVVREVDRGQPLVVREVEMRKGDTLEDLQTRIHQVEHEIIVEGARVVLADT